MPRRWHASDRYSPAENEDSEDEEEDDWEDELGHWDQARWHPFCLRWSELEAVVAHLRAAPDVPPPPPEVGMLLLARWVGHGS